MPTTDEDSAPFWRGLAEHRLVIQRCMRCGRAHFPLTPSCPHCASPEQALEDASGHGAVYSWVVIRRALHPAFAADVPYAIGLVELDEGPRVLGRILGDPRQVAAERRVTARYYRVGELTLLAFALDGMDPSGHASERD